MPTTGGGVERADHTRPGYDHLFARAARGYFLRYPRRRAHRHHHGSFASDRLMRLPSTWRRPHKLCIEFADAYRQVGVYADRILKPSDLFDAVPWAAS